jgi:AcrR family transcriptional regulator
MATTTRTRALDAAIDLIGTAGLRALTHARVDERAGLPKGSTSNHFRTRAALLCGVADRMTEQELGAFAHPAAPTSPDELVELLVGMLDYTTGANRTLTTARLVLFMEASHDHALRAVISRGHAAMRSWFGPMLAGVGIREPWAAADLLMSYADGLILNRIALGDDTDPRPALHRIVMAALG